MRTASIFPSKFLKPGDLTGRTVCKIEKVVMEDVGNDRRAVIYFVAQSKRLVLNKTNMRTIEEIAGTDETDDWCGLSVVLYPTKVDFQGRRLDTIRVDRVTSADKQPQNTFEEVSF